MLHDLPGEIGMTPTVGLLFSAVQENVRRLQSITAGMSQEELDYRGPDEKYNSTAQLMRHLMIVDLHWVYRIKSQPLTPPLQAQYGPMIDEHGRIPMVSGMCWHALMDQYEEVLRMLREACAQLTDDDLTRVVAFGHENEKEATLRWGIWHIADHNRYHQAQINQLRKWHREHSR